MAKTLQKTTGTGEASSGLPDARNCWSTFSLFPVRMETPMGWHPIIADWTVQSSRIRWESLTTTPLEVNWLWRKTETGYLSDRERRKLDEGFDREAAGAEKQAKANRIALEWKDEARSLRELFDLDAEGKAREYRWNGLPGCLAVMALTAKGRAVFLSAACCPPVSCRDPLGVFRRILKSVRVAEEGAPLHIVLPGLEVEWPAEWRLDGVRGREGHVYLDVEAPGKRVGLARLGFAEWHLANSSHEKVYASLAKVLFDRSEPGGPVQTTIGSGGKLERVKTVLGRAQEKDPEAEGTELAGHPGVLFNERRRIHIRMGDRIVRRFFRKYAGAATVLAWHCPASHSLWALSARCGEAGAEALAREMLSTVRCHPDPNPTAVDWAELIAEEARMQSGDDDRNPIKRGKPQIQDAAAWRRKQLGFRVRAIPEVRLEPSSKDGTGDLVYEATAPDTMLARALRGGRAPEKGYRRLALDAIGRQTWETLEHGPAVSDMLAILCPRFAAHPVEFFPKLLAFLKMLGERRLVESADEPPGVETKKAE